MPTRTAARYRGTPDDSPWLARATAPAQAEKNRADLARLVGVSCTWITQVMTLLWLAPEIQEAVLFGEVRESVTERELRGMAAEVVWSAQDGNRP